nr:GTA-gp10 family protein [Sandaracinobacteroides sayramensis]
MRGEVALKLPGLSLTLRPSFSALVAAEAEGGSLFRMLDRAAAGDVRLADIGALFWHCGGQAGARADFEAALLEAGPSGLLGPYRALLAAIFGRV